MHSRSRTRALGVPSTAGVPPSRGMATICNGLTVATNTSSRPTASAVALTPRWSMDSVRRVVPSWPCSVRVRPRAIHSDPSTPS